MWLHVECCSVMKEYHEQEYNSDQEEKNLVKHILGVPIRRGYANGDEEEDNAEESDDNDTDDEIMWYDHDPEAPDLENMKFPNKAQAYGTGWYRLHMYCQHLNREKKTELPHDWADQLLEDNKCVTDGWCRVTQDHDRRRMYGKWLVQLLKASKAGTKYACPICSQSLSDIM
jgi:hypothetical protein